MNDETIHVSTERENIRAENKYAALPWKLKNHTAPINFIAP